MSAAVHLSPSALRADLYNLLDRVLDTGEPLEIERQGQILRIVPARASLWTDRLPRREGVVTGDSDDLVNQDWSDTWNPGPLGSETPGSETL